MISVPPHSTRGDRLDAASSGVHSGQESIPTVEVASIIGTGREAVIVHKGERYRLRVTANDKLILTK